MHNVPADLDLINEFKEIGRNIGVFSQYPEDAGRFIEPDRVFPDDWSDEDLTFVLLIIQAYRGDLLEHIVGNYDASLKGNARNNVYEKLRELRMQTGFANGTACSMLMRTFFTIYDSVYKPGILISSPQASIERRQALLHKINYWDSFVCGYDGLLGDDSVAEREKKQWGLDY